MTHQSTKVSQALLSYETIDRAVGMNVRRIRLFRRLSLEHLGDAVGVTYQQIQKYENGKNRISCRMLVQITAALDCSLDDIFDALPGFEKGVTRFDPRWPKSEDIAMAYSIERVPDPRVRQSLRDLVDELAAKATPR